MKLTKLNKSTLSIWLGLLATLIVVSCTEDAVTQGNTPPSDPVIPEIAITSGFSIVVTDGNSTEDKNRVIGKVFAKSQESTNRTIRIERFVTNQTAPQIVKIFNLEATNSAGDNLDTSKKVDDIITINYDATGKQIESDESKIFVTNADNTATTYRLELNLKEVSTTTYTGVNVWDRAAKDAVMSNRAVFTLTGLEADTEVTWNFDTINGTKTLTGTSLELTGSELGLNNVGILGGSGARFNDGDQVVLKIWVTNKGQVYFPKITYYDSDLYSWQGLQAMRKGLTNHYVIKRDITFPAPGTEGFPLNGFTPVGDNTTPFTGILDGEGHTLKDFYISNVGANSSVGLFGRVSETTIKNLFLEGGKIYQENLGGTDSAIGAGSIVGSITGGTLTLSNVGVSDFKLITKKFYGVGGLVGSVQVISGGSPNIQKSYFQGDIHGEAKNTLKDIGDAGGLIGYSEYISIKQSYVKANMTGMVRSMGGLFGTVGIKSSSISEAYFQGNIENTLPNAVATSGTGWGFNSINISDVYTVGKLNIYRGNASGIVFQARGWAVHKTVARMSIRYFHDGYSGASPTFSVIGQETDTVSNDVYYDSTATISNTNSSLPLAKRKADGSRYYEILDGQSIDITTASKASFQNFDFQNVWEWRGGGKWPVLRNVPNKGRQP